MERMDRDMPFLLQYEHVAWFEKGKVRILDRRVYPTEVRFVVCTDYHEVVQAIADMVTQSAGPYTAVGMGMALAAWQVRDKGAREQEEFLRQAAYDLAHARPTTANRYGQITCRCADVAKETLAAGRDPVEAIGIHRGVPEPPVQHHAGGGGLSGESDPQWRRHPDPVLRRDHHRHSDPGRQAAEQDLPGLLRGDTALFTGGPAHVQLLCPDGHRYHGPDRQYDRLRHGAGGHRPLHLSGGLHRLGRPYRQQDRHFPDRHPGQVFRGCPTMSPASRTGRSGRRTTSSSRCGTRPSPLIGGSPTRSPG